MTGKIHTPGKKVLFLAPYPFNRAPSQRFRFEQYFKYLGKNGIHFGFRSFYSESLWQKMSSGKVLAALPGLVAAYLTRIFHVLLSIRYNRIFIHRELTPAGPPVYEWILARLFRKKIIYDFDDAIWLTDDETRNRFLYRMKWASKVGAVCRMSRMVSCGNEYLQSFALKCNPHSLINPTTIDMDAISGRRHVHKPGNIIIGWTGSHTTLKYLYMIRDPLKEILKNPGITLRIICNRRPHWDINEYNFIEWSRDNEVEDLLNIDIGLMPLPDDQWTRGKCGFKAIQYLALGIPALVSPLEVNRQIVDHGSNGYYCSSAANWINYVLELAGDPLKRDKFGTSGIQKISANYSAVSNLSNFLGFFE